MRQGDCRCLIKGNAAVAAELVRSAAFKPFTDVLSLNAALMPGIFMLRNALRMKEFLAPPADRNRQGEST
jgi:hypothetical protein